jgi:hypothetical protein
MSDAFSQKRLDLLEAFANLQTPGDPVEISQVWSRHYCELKESRGVFAVNDPLYEKTIPGDRDFGCFGFLRCWMSSTRLLLIQNRNSARNFLYSAPIFCDTNFVSFCEAFESGRSLRAHQAAFEQALEFLFPMAFSTNAFPYLIENADNSNREKIRAVLRAFAAFQLTSSESFRTNGRFIRQAVPHSPEQIADDCLKMMSSPDFKVLHAWMKKYYLWARIILLKSTLLVFHKNKQTLEGKFYTLLKFLHEEMARLPQFEVLVVYRFFAASSADPFFGHVQQNAQNLDRALTAMSWDLAHWRGLFDMLLITSSLEQSATFPLPHFLTFDKPFVRLIEPLRLDGLIYAQRQRRCEQSLDLAWKD